MTSPPVVPAPDRTPGPQLFFSAADLPRLRRNFALPLFAGLRSSLTGFDRAAERRFLRAELDPSDQLTGLARLALSAEQMAMLHLLTGDADAADLAVECIRGILRFPIWDYFLDGNGRTLGSQRAPSSIIAVACVLDWLGESVAPEERVAWLQAVADRGCAACHRGLEVIRHPRRGTGWFIDPASSIARVRSDTHTDGTRLAEITQTTNLRAVPAGGLALGVVLLARHGQAHPDLPAWFESAIHAIRAFGEIYEPDGSYDEGVHYADYAGRSLMVGITALQRAGVADLRHIVDWSGHARYLLNLSMPTRENPFEVVNISDNGRSRLPQIPPPPPETRSALPFWIAREFRDTTAQWYGLNLAAAHNPWSLIFHDETVPAEPPAAGPQVWCPAIGWIVARTGYAADDLVVSLRSGRGANHEHADRNSIILKHRGEPLIVDPLRPPYSYADPAWAMRETAGHSAVLIGGLGHHYHNGVEGTNATFARARIVHRHEGPGHAVWLSDATHAYRLRDAFIRSVVRGIVVLFDLPCVLAIDRVTRWRDTATVEARFFGDNWADQCAITTAADGFAISRPGACAVARVFGRHPLTVAKGILPIPPERARLHPFVTVMTPAVDATTLVTVIALPSKGSAGPNITCDFTAGRLVVRIKDAPAVEIDDAGDLPVITLAPST